MSQDCIFCGIVDGEIPSYTVYEDDDVIAFLDANPRSQGHTLVVPKDHHETLADLPENLGAAVGRALTKVAPAVESAVGAEASTVGFNNGEAAGQEIPHVHAHVIPRDRGDGGQPINAVVGPAPDLDDEEMTAIMEDVQAEFT